jgi:hypothetical protein
VLNLTKQLVWLTVALVFLTAVLLIFTIYLSYDTYLNDQRARQEYKARSENREPESRGIINSALSHRAEKVGDTSREKTRKPDVSPMRVN